MPESSFGVGWPEAVIVLVILAVSFLPALGVYRIAQRAGYGHGACVLWAIAYVIPITQWLVPLSLGFWEWPRDRTGA